jgi:hypothetical protein
MKKLPFLLFVAIWALIDQTSVRPAASAGDAPVNQWVKQEKAMIGPDVPVAVVWSPQLNSEAFTAIGVQKVEEQPVHLPKMVGVPMSKVLQMLLSQIKGDEEFGTYLIRGGEVEITTTANASPSKWTSEARRFAPSVDADFDRVPLEDALRELAERSGISIVLDIRVGENARKPVTATLKQVPVDSAVRVVADMTDLRMTVVDNVLYVTTRENAKEWELRQTKK